jgi:hypothetical protein
VPETVQVETEGVRVHGTRDFGDVYLALCLWRTLGLDDFFEKELPEGREEIPRHLTVSAPAVARFCEPSSELHVEGTWCRRTFLSGTRRPIYGRAAPVPTRTEGRRWG